MNTETSTAFYAASLLGWPRRNIAVYFEVPEQTVEDWVLGKYPVPTYVFATLVTGLRGQCDNGIHPDEKEQYIRDVVRELLKGIELSPAAMEEARDFMQSRMEEYIEERTAPYLEKIDHLERVREGEPSRNFHRFVQSAIDDTEAELVESLRAIGVIPDHDDLH